MPIPIEIDDVDENPPTKTPNTNHGKASSSTKDKGRRHNKKDHDRSSHKKKKRHHHDEKPPLEPIHQFTGNEDFYVDKKSERGYLRVETLHRPACPKQVPLLTVVACPFLNRILST